MQRLYENHKVLTYPENGFPLYRQGCCPDDQRETESLWNRPISKIAGALLTKPIHTNGSFVDDKKVSDHHAIIPTEQFVQLDHMTNEERKIYDMVVRRFLSVLYSPFEYEQTSMEREGSGTEFCGK